MKQFNFISKRINYNISNKKINTIKNQFKLRKMSNNEGNSGINAKKEKLIFNPDDYNERLKLKALKIPSRECHQAVNSLEKYVLNRPNIKAVRKEAGIENERILLLNEIYNQLDMMPSDLINYIKNKNYDIIDYNLELK